MATWSGTGGGADPLDDLGDLTFDDGAAGGEENMYSQVDLLDNPVDNDPLKQRTRSSIDLDADFTLHDDTPEMSDGALAGWAAAATVLPPAPVNVPPPASVHVPPPAPVHVPPPGPPANAPLADPLSRPEPASPTQRAMSAFSDEPLSPPPPPQQREHGGTPARGTAEDVQEAAPSAGLVYGSVTQTALGSSAGADGEGGSAEIHSDDAYGSSVAAGVPPPDVPVRVWVQNPEKAEATSKLGLKTSYFAYLVRTDSTLPSLYASGVEVRRRFSEFEALHKLLKALYRGYFIPPLPEKSFIEAKIANDDFLRLRRADLQAFLRGVAHHPVMREGEALHVFLLQPGELAQTSAWLNLQHQAHPPPGAPAAGGGGNGSGELADAPSVTTGAVKVVYQWASWVKQSVGVAPPSRLLSEEEQTLRKNKELLGDLERLLELSCASARSLCAHMSSVCADFHDLGRNMGMLTRFEETVQAKNGQYTEIGTTAAGRAEDLQRLAHASGKQTTLWKTLSLKTAASLVSLHDYMIMMPEAVAALEEREAALAQVWALEDELVSRQQALLAASGAKVANRDKRVAALNQAIASAEDQIRAAQDTYRVITARNLSELSRLGLERGADFRRMMGQFSATQAELLKASAAMWAVTAVQFGVRPSE